MKIVSLYFFYILFTVVNYFFGPLEYGDENNLITFMYIVICYSFIFLGIFFGYYSIDVLKEKSDAIKFSKIRFLSILSLIPITTSLIVVIDLYLSYIHSGDGELTISKLYYANVNSDKSGGLVTTLISITSPLFFYLLVSGVLNYQRFRLVDKILFLSLVIFSVLSYLLKGTNFGLFVIIVTLFVAFLSKTDSGNKKIIFRAFTIVSIVIVLFILNVGSRLNIDYVPKSISGITINQDNIIVKNLKPSLALGYITASAYPTQGYRAVSLMFNYDFNSMFGIGSGYFTLAKLGYLLGDDAFNETYQYKMNDKWGYRKQWHTAFVWLANDVSYFGVFPLCLLLGMLAGIIYKAVKINRCAIDISLFSIIVIILMFVPANNILMSNPLVFFSFFSLFFLWLFLNRDRIKIRC